MRRDNDIGNILEENNRRVKAINNPFNPVTGEGSVGVREKIVIPDFLNGTVLWLPEPMFESGKLLELVAEAGSIKDFILSQGLEYDKQTHDKVAEGLIRLRLKHDFPFYAATLVKIKAKGGGEDVPFVLNRPQRTRLIPAFEEKRLQNKPIRLIVCKARQWGGSTGTQQYDGWWQTMLDVGLNSLIVGHIASAAIEVEDMFKKTLDNFPVQMLYPMGASYSMNEAKFVSVFGHPNIHRIPQRNCKIKIGTAENPNSARGGDYNLVHCTEVGLWKKTDGKSPEDIVDSATSGMLYRPKTSIVYESTAKGTGTFFHREYVAAKEHTSQFEALFVAWYEIDTYSLPFGSEEEKADFASWLWQNKENTHSSSDREEAGSFYWYVWGLGATLEAIHWYVEERKKYNDHGHMASEYPTDDIEAFVYAGAHVFDRYKVELLRPSCNVINPKIGDLQADAVKGEGALKNIRFVQDPNAELYVWEEPDIDKDNPISDRYVVAVDIGGRSNKADWSVVVVLDRYWMIEGDKPCVVAQLRCHTDMDLLAWKAAQIASWYDNALLVIESNTLETKDKERFVDGDNSVYILEQLRYVYDNLYARERSAEEIKQDAPKKYGFHTNVSTKPELIANLVEFVREGLYVERDPKALDELLQYERKPNGSFGAIQGFHDDLLMARAIALYISTYKMSPPRRIKKERYIGLSKKTISEATI